MAEEQKKKPKIDLKARLGKKTVSAAGGASIPPPVGMGPGASIPAPPFSSPSRPRVDPSDPMASAPMASGPMHEAVAPAQAIKIEMSEEVVEAQKKGRVKLAAVALATAVVGGIIGFAFGGGAERGKRHDIAIQGAGMLKEEVDKANTEIEKLADVLKKAKTQLREGKYPEAEVAALGGIDIPFDATYLTGKGIGLMGNDVNRLLIQFAGDAAAANEQKDRLKLVLGQKTLITEFLDRKENPKVSWGVFVAGGPGGPMASMQPLPEPFLVKSDKKDKDGKAYAWPDEFEIKDGDKTHKLKRYTKGEPTSSTPEIIPVDPSTEGMVCPNDTLMRLSSEITKLEQMLRGDKSDPTNEKMGLVDTGSALIERLKGIGVAS